MYTIDRINRLRKAAKLTPLSPSLEGLFYLESIATLERLAGIGDNNSLDCQKHYVGARLARLEKKVLSEAVGGAAAFWLGADSFWLGAES
jgi:hypothetical protein